MRDPQKVTGFAVTKGRGQRGPTPPPYLGKKIKKNICLFHVSEHVDHFKATFFYLFF